MALSTARIHRVRGRPPLLAAGINSLIHSHSSSVRSLGYIFSFIYPFYTTCADFSDRLSTVGMPVARHPPYSPGRAVFPHPVLRLYSLPRCKAAPSGKHSPTWNLRNTRTRYLDAVEDVGKLLPRVAPLLASPPVEPFKRNVNRPMEEAVEQAR